MVKTKINHMQYKGIDPLTIIKINETYILGIYQGKLSVYDIVIRYRQRENKDKWSRIRTKKHIHWAVDMLLKMYHNKEQAEKFLDFLIGLWDEQITPLSSHDDRALLLDIEKLKIEANKEALKCPKIANKGEYSIKFLYLLAKLLMIQEKTNFSSAYMFKSLLDALKSQKDIYKIVTIATKNRKN